MSGPAERRLRIGVDIGGTFTDFVAVLEGGDGPSVQTLKLPTTPDEPARAVVEGVRRLASAVGDGQGAAGPDVVHGSTVATNALLERAGARTALVATGGFRDVLHLARQDRSGLHDLAPSRPRPLVPPERCVGIEERTGPDGEVVRPLDEEAVRAAAGELAEEEVESVALCFLHAFARPDHEARAAELLREAGLRVSASHEVLPEFREYERASTTAVDAYVGPVVERYLAGLEEALPARRLRVMQSGGGSADVRAARERPVGSVLSGPAAGVVGGLHAARRAGFEGAITLDMGGTSTDVSLARGEPRVTTEATVGGLPVAIPVVDLHTVGSGGGSVARIDAGGALRVGPRSAGAAPGPVCYGRGGERPTVTDAHLALGRMAPGRFLGGEMPLDADAARRALEELGREAGLGGGGGPGPARAAALGVVRVIEARMERALRVISVERGHDPADFALVAFGGAGGLHACRLARALGMERVLVPPEASVLSAFGMLAGDVVRERGRTVMARGGAVDAGELLRRAEPMVEEVRRGLAREGVPEERIRVRRSVEMRYRGQSYELRVPLEEGFVDRFHRRHRERYGHAAPGDPVEVVTLRVRGEGRVDPPPRPRAEPGDPDPSAALLERREAVVARGDGGAKARAVPFYDGGALRAGHRLEGPAVVARADTTVWLGPGDRAEVDREGSLRVEVGP